MARRWLFLDCFNTLVDDFDEGGDETGIGAFAEIPVAAGLYPDREAFRRAYLAWRAARWGGGDDWSEVVLGERLRQTLAGTGADPERVEAVVADMLTAFARDPFAGLRPTPGAAAALRRWRPHLRMVLISNHFVPGFPRRVLERYGLARFFDHVVDSAELGVKKPHPRFYRRARELAACQPRAALAIGDNLRNDVRAPRRHGLQAVHFDRHRERPGLRPSSDPRAARSWPALEAHIDAFLAADHRW